MSSPLSPVITRAGLAAVVNAQNSGFQATIVSVAVGRGIAGPNGIFGGYAPQKTATALASEASRVPIISGSRLDPVGFRVLARVPPAATPEGYAIREVGFFLATGELLAVWSDPNQPLAYTTGLSDVDLALDLYLEQLPVSALAITVTEPDVVDTAGILAGLIRVNANLFSATLAMQERIIAAKTH